MCRLVRTVQVPYSVYELHKKVSLRLTWLLPEGPTVDPEQGLGWDNIRRLTVSDRGSVATKFDKNRLVRLL